MYSTYAAMHCGGYVCDDQGARVYSNRRDPPGMFIAANKDSQRMRVLCI